MRLRFAPSPTGTLHIGGVRTALYNWAAARRSGGTFLLRVEDTDPERSKPEFETAILEGLRWVGLEWDEGPDVGGEHGPYRQSERLEAHLGVAAQLRRSGWAYPCFCSRERLDELRAAQEARKETPRYDGHCRSVSEEEAARRIEAGESFVLRFRTPEGKTTFRDLVRGEVTFDNSEVDDWVLIRTDGSPTYNFVCVCDDAAMEITHVVRGEEHLVNTPKQIHLFNVLGVPAPTFAHLPLMLGTSGKKMSKRDGDTAVTDYRDRGFPPEAVLNFLALQGWALDGETEIFSRDTMVEHFDLERVSKGGSIFDPEKFQWMAGEYLRSEPLAQTAERSKPFVVAAGLASEEDLAARADWFERAVATVRERVQLYSEVPAALGYLFADDASVEFEEKAEKGARKHGEAGLSALADLSAWLTGRLGDGASAEALGSDLKGWVQDRGVKIPVVFQPLRCALSGKPGGPDLAEMMLLLGPEKVAARLAAAIARLSA